MWEKVGWLFLWTTMAFWAGCAAAPQGDAGDTRMAADDARLPAIVIAEANPDELEPVAGAVEVDPEATFDRSGWERQLVSPRRGRVAHWPVYYGEDVAGHTIRFTEDRPSPLLEEPDMACELEAALADQTHLYGGGQALDGLVGPFLFAFDTVALPVRLVRTPPWRIQHTPER